MLKISQTRVAILASLVPALFFANTATAGSHLWRVNEIYSSADSRVQFIELLEIGGSDLEFHLTGRWFMTNGAFYQIPSDLPGPTANLKFLLATQAFAALPGAPNPDYVIPEGFIDPAGDELVWFTYDLVTLDPGVVPTDGVLSYHRFSSQSDVNSPTNFAGETGSITYVDTDGDGIADALDNCTAAANSDQRDSDGDGYGNPCDADLNDDCVVNPIDLGIFRTAFLTSDPDADFNGDSIVNPVDLGIFRTLFLDPPGPSGITDTCGPIRLDGT